MHDPIGTAAVGRAGAVGGLWAVRAVRGWLALILLACALALPALPVHADATGDLFEAAESGTASEVKAALAAGADPGARTEDSLDETPLHQATCCNDNPSVITALIEGGADPGARNAYGDTPLRWGALYNTNPSVFAALIEGGSNPGARNKEGETPLHAAMRNPYQTNPAVIAALIEGGADPGARNEDGATPLHLTARFDSNPSVIEALLKAGADPGARDDAGKTPFNYAKDNEALKGTEAYWLLNDGRFE